MYLKNLKITLPSDQIDRVSDWLFEQGALSVTLEDAQDKPVFEPLPDEVILWENTSISALFEQGVSLMPLTAQLEANYVGVQCQCESVTEKDWVNVWQEQTIPLCFQNQLWICSSLHEPPDPLQPCVRLDPGLAFGTGTHPTTALCLDWLAAHPPRKQCVIDYGCGSGILALAALKLGAAHVYAIDYDPQARQATQNNALLNHINDEVLTILAPGEPLPAVDVLLANILANPLIELADYFATLLKPQGQLILSGILANQFAMIESAYQPYFDHILAQEKEGWLCVLAKKKI